MIRRILGRGRSGGSEIGRPISETALASDPTIRVYHKFESGNLLADSSGNNRTALVNTGGAFIDGKFGKGIDLSSSTARLQLATTAIPQGAFTVMFWTWMFNDSWSGAKSFFSLGDSAGTWGIDCSTNRNLSTSEETQSFSMVTGGAGRSCNTPSTLEDFPYLTKVHRAYTYSGTEMKQYINGELVATGTATANIRGVNTVVYLGWLVITGNYSNSAFSDLGIFGKACTQSEIQSVAL